MPAISPSLGSIDVRPNAIYTLREVCQLLGVAPGTARRWIKAGRLPAAQIGRAYRVLGSQLLWTIAAARDLQ